MSNMRFFQIAAASPKGRGLKTGLVGSSGSQAIGGLPITGAVGSRPPPRCQNQSDDVLAVQKALNRFTPIDGGPLTRLKEDGEFGPHTGQAIVRFQNKWAIVIFKEPGERTDIHDGIVDPGGPTSQRLSAGPGAQFSAQDEFNRSFKLTSSILLAGFKSITKIITNLSASPSNSKLLLLSGDPDFIAFERNFHASRSKSALGLAQFIASKIKLMGIVHQRLTKPNNNLLSIDFASEETLHCTAFSFSGGMNIFINGQPPFQFLSQHKIYFCPRARALDDIGIAYVILHEFGHYVDSNSDDFAYFDGTLHDYLNLTSEKAKHNGDCYSQFLFDCAGFIEFKVSDHVKF